jgi:hypothetical protein
VNEPRVTMRHMRQAGYCSRGCRAFFARHGLDWTGFLKGGIEAGALEATGDAMAVNVAGIARREADDGR